jgi:hypothetical protein
MHQCNNVIITGQRSHQRALLRFPQQFIWPRPILHSAISSPASLHKKAIGHSFKYIIAFVAYSFSWDFKRRGIAERLASIKPIAHGNGWKRKRLELCSRSKKLNIS